MGPGQYKFKGTGVGPQSATRAMESVATGSREKNRNCRESYPVAIAPGTGLIHQISSLLELVIAVAEHSAELRPRLGSGHTRSLASTQFSN